LVRIFLTKLAFKLLFKFPLTECMFLHYLGKTEQAKLKIGKVNPEI